MKKKDKWKEKGSNIRKNMKKKKTWEKIDNDENKHRR